MIISSTEIIHNYNLS